MQKTQHVNKRSMIGWIFLCCWMTYLTAYLCRVNFSSALHAITLEKGFTEEQILPIGIPIDPKFANCNYDKKETRKKLGLDPTVEYSRSAIGILTVSPAETAIIAGDISIKASGAQLGFVDRFSGTVILTGTFSEVEASLKAVTAYAEETLGFTVCKITKT